jgi:hypothetical protein
MFKGGHTAHVGVPANVINVEALRTILTIEHSTSWRGRQQGRQEPQHIE